MTTENNTDLWQHGWISQEAAEYFKDKMADPDRPGAWIERDGRTERKEKKTI